MFHERLYQNGSLGDGPINFALYLYTSAISNMHNIDKMSSDVVGLVGVPAEISCCSEFEGNIIMFKEAK